ncbi:ABC transporter C family member 10-like [Panicum miliaceum]|uniref:ABC transporter C family member 10-like n=1 Tax=Panicum miliaceum TaxID=4540 RepID=A0A3L6T244_PANMI|nr:ABC transporter C family member 10-like [Panicum miliaceum]
MRPGGARHVGVRAVPGATTPAVTEAPCARKNWLGPSSAASCWSIKQPGVCDNSFHLSLQCSSARDSCPHEILFVLGALVAPKIEKVQTWPTPRCHKDWIGPMGSLTSSWMMNSCGSPICSRQAAVSCAWKEPFDSSTCLNHLLVSGIATLIVIILALQLIVIIPKNRASTGQLLAICSPLHLAAVVFDGCQGLVYLCLGPWMLWSSSFNQGASVYLPHWWLPHYYSLSMEFGTLRMMVMKELKMLYVKPLNTKTVAKATDFEGHVTPFSNAAFFSTISFWWLNPLMKIGYEKPLEEKDLPVLGTTDQAYNQYLMFLEKLNSKKRLHPHGTPSVFWTIISCHKSGIIVSGFFALLKVLMLSSGPVLLKAFINVSLGKGTFKYEGYVLAAALFFCKCCESLSERQWFFCARRLGLQVRSFLSAAIYKKQQRVSNSAKMKHSSGEIMNYVTVDAYRIGEFPYWFHQSWTTSVQLCIALAILYNAVGLAMIASLLVIIITVLCNAPLAKLQHKFQSKLMEAQDVRLKTMSESLIHMKILKLYAWEIHFKKVIEGLREVEYRWLSAFQLRRGYNSLLFWSSPVLVSAATFLACYLLKIPLDASNVFTFVATLRLVQNPIRQIPEVIVIVIQAKVAFTRIAKFLDAPELDEQVRKKYHVGSEYPIEINSCSFSWNESSSKPTLKNINFVVRTGKKVAICGEVGSEKSTLLAAVLGEVPKTEGKLKKCTRKAVRKRDTSNAIATQGFEDRKQRDLTTAERTSAGGTLQTT